MVTVSPLWWPVATPVRAGLEVIPSPPVPVSSASLIVVVPLGGVVSRV